MAESAATDPGSPFSLLTDDVVIAILAKLDSDPRHWAHLSCASTRFASLIHDVCCKEKCNELIPSVDGPGPGGWAALHRVTVCCPGLDHAGVLLDNSDFGLELDIGPNHVFPRTEERMSKTEVVQEEAAEVTVPSDCEGWTMVDDLYPDAVYDLSESEVVASSSETEEELKHKRPAANDADEEEIISNKKGKKTHHHALFGNNIGVHLAEDSWTPSRQQGSKLLSMRFRDDCLYICDQGGCVHTKEKREYTLFRGVFKDFKKTCVWRTIKDCGKQNSHLGCAFCRCKETWDLMSTFCLRRTFGYHDDGEPMVRAFVCENGHVSGARTIGL